MTSALLYCALICVGLGITWLIAWPIAAVIGAPTWCVFLVLLLLGNTGGKSCSPSTPETP